MARKIEVYVIVEGGGDQRVLDADFRRGYQAFLRQIVPDRIGGRPVAMEVVRGKGRSTAYDKFCDHYRLHSDALIVLLLDSEGKIPFGADPWDFLKKSENLDRPGWATEEHLYLMVQCVETWLAKDVAALRSIFGKCLNEKRLPARANLEEEPKGDWPSARPEPVQNRIGTETRR